MKQITTILTAFSIIIISILVASVFGALHNQVSYSISSEFFKNFLFGKFGINEWGISNDRTKASIVGIIGTYWVGFFLGIIYSIIYLFLNVENKFLIIIKSIFINISVSVFGSLIAFLIAYFFISPENSGVFMDFGTMCPKNYIEAAYMHTGSYYGGVLGLFLGIIFLLNKNKKKEI